MTQDSPVLGGFLAPHPPVIIPAIGRGSHEADQTIAALKSAAADLGALHPETVVILSPHAPNFRNFIFFYSGQLTGTFQAFGRPDIGRSFRTDPELSDAIIAELGPMGLSGGYLSAQDRAQYDLSESLDHGVLVPLHFLLEQIPETPIVALSSSGMDAEPVAKLGQAIRQAAVKLNRRIVLVASGDLSHKVNAESPYGSCPEGARFDHQVIAALVSGDLDSIRRIDPTLREAAAECGYRSLIALCGAFAGIPVETKVYHYEAPYGIGYAVASIVPKQADPVKHQGSVPVQIALHTLTRLIGSHQRTTRKDLVEIGLALDPWLNRQAGVFVSLKKFGQLRGCIGTTGPTTPSVAEEIIQNAVSAATQDPRFNPVSAAEIPDLVISVDILGPATPVTETDALDPRVDGVIVRHGGRTGLLLPDLEGVDTVEEQLSIACRKAGIDPRLPYSIERFQVTRYF